MPRSAPQSPGFTPAEASYLASACLAGEVHDDLTDPQSARSALGQLTERPAHREDVGERVIHKAIEEAVVRATKSGGRVFLDESALLYVLSHQRLQHLTLSREAKLRLSRALEELREAPGPGWSVELDDDVQYVLGPHLRRWIPMLREYTTMRDQHLVVDPNIMGGTPVIRGTRISVYSVLGRVDDGETIDDLVADYPDVSREAFQTAVAYARTHPRRGRPKRFR